MNSVRFFIFGGFSLAVFLSSIFLTEASSLKAFSPPVLFEFTQKPTEVAVRPFQDRLHIETNKAPLTEIQFSGRDLIRLDENTSVDIYFSEDGIKAKLLSGNLWAGRFHGDPEMTIEVGDMTVFPSNGSGSIRREGQQIEASFSPLFATKGPASNIPSLIIFPFESSKGGKLIENDIEGRPCGPVGCKNFHPWFQKNEKLDELLLDKKKKDFQASIESRGAHFSNITGFFFHMKNKGLTLKNFFSLRENVDRQNTTGLASMLIEDVFYFSSVNDQRSADSRFSLSSEILSSLSDKNISNEFWKDQYRSVSWIPERRDALASFRDAFRYEVMKQGGKEKYLLALESLGGLFQALESKDTRGFLAVLKKYEAEIDNFFPGKQPHAFYKLHMILFGHLSQKYPDMALSGAFLETVSFFENRMLDQVSSQDRQGIITGLISSKIETMKKVAKRLSKNESLQLLREVMLELAKQTSALAVLLPVDAPAHKDKENYFAKESSLLAFLGSSPLSDDDDFPAMYQAFITQQDENRKIDTLLYGAVSGEIKDDSQDEETIKKDFEGIELSVYELIIPVVPGEWYGVRNASIENISFQASYSPQRKAFRNIVLEERLYPFAIQLEKFKAFLLGATTAEESVVSQEPLEEAVDETSENRFEKLLKNRVVEKMDGIGLAIEAGDLEIVDAEKTIVQVQETEFRTKSTPAQTITISFTFQNTSDEILELKVQTPANEILVKDIFPFQELIERATLIYGRAKLEIERLEEEAQRTDPVY